MNTRDDDPQHHQAPLPPPEGSDCPIQEKLGPDDDAGDFARTPCRRRRGRDLLIVAAVIAVLGFANAHLRQPAPPSNVTEALRGSPSSTVPPLTAATPPPITPAPAPRATTDPTLTTNSPATVVSEKPTPANSATPDLAAVNAALAWESSDTVLDANPHATAVRAQEWATPAIRAALVTAAPLGSAGAPWQSWCAHRAHLEVAATLTADDHPADSATVAARSVAILATPVGRDGWVGAPITSVDMVVLERTPIGWRLSSITPR